MGWARAKLVGGWLGWCLGFAAEAVILVLLGFRWFLVGFIPCVLVMIIGLRLIRSSRPRLARSAETALAGDKRAPVLYLRSFRDDEFMQHYSTAVDEPQGRTNEQALASIFSLVGPVVALSEPRAAPRLGVARTQHEDSQWQDTVIGLMQAATLVVMRIGDSEGFSWEVEQALKLVRPERLVFFLPVSGERWRQFRDLVRRQLPDVALPAGFAQPGAPRRQQGIKFGARGVLYFDSDWTSHVSLFAFRLGNLLRLSWKRNPVLDAALWPVLARMGVPRQAPVTLLSLVVLTGFAGLGVLIAAGGKEREPAILGFALGIAAITVPVIRRKLHGKARPQAS
jgi:hypothetical protein